MALHTDLTIYKHAFALFSVSMRAAKDMRRDAKQLIGHEMYVECIAILHAVRDANSHEGADRMRFIDALHRHIHGIEILMRHSRDERLLSPKIYGEAIQLTQSIGRQAGGWRRKTISPVS